MNLSGILERIVGNKLSDSSEDLADITDKVEVKEPEISEINSSFSFLDHVRQYSSILAENATKVGTVAAVAMGTLVAACQSTGSVEVRNPYSNRILSLISVREPTGLKPIYPTDASCPQAASHSMYGSKVNLNRTSRSDGAHNGIDIPMSYGAPITSIADGKVVAKLKSSRYGSFVVVRHSPDDTGYKRRHLWSSYYHTQSNAPVKLEQRVKKGQVIAYVGSHDGGNHLHLTTSLSVGGRYNSENFSDPGWQVDPLQVLNRFGTYNLKDMTDSNVNIPYMNVHGEMNPAGNRVAWPFKCELKVSLKQ